MGQTRRFPYSRSFKIVAGVASLILAASCSGGGSTGGGSASETIVYVDFGSGPDRINATAPEKFMDLVEERSNGQIKFDRTYGGTLVSQEDQLQGLESGIYQMGYYIPTYAAARLPVSTIIDLPFVLPDAENAFDAGTEFLTSEDAVTAEWDQVGAVPLMVQSNTPIDLIVKERATRPEDFRGLTIRSPGPTYDPILRALGANPVQVSTPDIPSALSRGTIGGALYGIDAALQAGLITSAKYVVELKLGGVNGVIYLDKNVWDGFSEELKDIITQAREEALDHAAQVLGDALKKSNDALRDAGGELISLDSATHEELSGPVAESIYQEWGNALSSGSDGSVLIDRLRTLGQQSGK